MSYFEVGRYSNIRTVRAALHNNISYTQLNYKLQNKSQRSKHTTNSLTTIIMATSYRPTAFERAYASHLLQTYFQTPHSDDNDIEIDNTPLRIPGRQAVPFLTTSGVERTLLRLFWSVVDPEAVGTLVVRNQFQVLLLLVAMAQAHFLPPLTAIFDIVTMADDESSSSGRRLLLRKLQLPTFPRYIAYYSSNGGLASPETKARAQLIKELCRTMKNNSRSYRNLSVWLLLSVFRTSFIHLNILRTAPFVSKQLST